MKELKIFIGILLLIIILSFSLPGIFLPTDILNNYPSFSTTKWDKPQNSLLSDAVFQFEPWRVYTKSQLQNGTFPLWNNLNGSGTPFFANMISAILFPLNFIYYILPTAPSLYLISFLKLYFLGLFSYLYFKKVLKKEKFAFMGAVAVSFSGFPILWLLWPQTNVYMFFPLLLYITEEIREQPKKYYKWYLFLSIVYFLAVLGGHPETLFDILLLHVSYLLFRLWNQKKQLFISIGFVFLGIITSAIQILPFIEYILHSDIVQQRGLQTYTYYLPLKSIIMQIFPFILGAPQLNFYKPIASFTNFQEVMSGYVGAIVLISAIYVTRKYFSDNLVKYWTIMIILIYGIAYNIYPFKMLSYLPILHSNANQRLTGFASIGFIFLACYGFSKVDKNKINIPFSFQKLFYLISIVVSLLLVFLPKYFPKHIIGNSTNIAFVYFLQNHIAYIFLTTFLFLQLVLFTRNKYIVKYKFELVILLILSQTLFLLWNYNPITAKSVYYPRTPLTQELQQIPSGKVIEIGNPSLAPDSNLAYGISGAESYDAIDVKSYKTTLNAYFPIRNIWDKVDETNINAFQKLGIKYILSDFDINLKRQIYQGRSDTILPPLSHSRPASYSVINSIHTLSGIRVLFATFNRSNNCIVTITFKDDKTSQTLLQKNIYCSNTRNYMYYFVSTNNITLNHDNLRIVLQSNSDNTQNNVALVGDKGGYPYIELFSPPSKQVYKKLWELNDEYIWSVPDANFIVFDGKNILKRESSNTIQIATNYNHNASITAKVVNYPGWKVSIDGKTGLVNKNDLFLSTEVPKGKHVILFYYAPMSFYIGLIVTIVILVSIGFYILVRETYSIKILCYNLIRTFQKKRK